MSEKSELTREDLMLMEDYKVSINFIFHEDRRKADLFKLFYWTQAGIIAFYGWNFEKGMVSSIWISIFAITISFYWALMMERMRIVISGKYKYLKYLEGKLEHVSNISTELELKSSGYQQKGEHKLYFFHRISVSISESILPIIVALLWVISF